MEEPLEDDEIKVADLSDIPRLKGDEEIIVDLPPMLSLKYHEEVKGEKGLKISTPNKLLNRLPILLAQIKAGNNPYKLKNEIRQCYIFCISIIKSPKNFATIS